MIRLLLRAATTVTMLLAGATISVASPAAAAAPADECRNHYGHSEEAGNYITAYAYRICIEGADTPLSVRIQRYRSPGVYETVAEGLGRVTYRCGGSLYNVYRTTGTPDFGILCS
jgi:hypothetical protein